MKTHLLLLPLLAMCPALALAQPKSAPTKTAPQIFIDPAAQALMDKATAKYKTARGLRFEAEVEINGQKTGISSVSFARPDLLRVEYKGSPFHQQFLEDSTNFYFVKGKTFEESMRTRGKIRSSLSLGLGGEASGTLGEMLEGRSILNQIHIVMSSNKPQSVRASVSLLSPQVVDGSLSNGVRLSLERKNSSSRKAKFEQFYQGTFWFGNDSTLRRIQTISFGPSVQAEIVRRERVFNQQLNPTFPPDTFKFDPTGLTLAAEEKPRS